MYFWELGSEVQSRARKFSDLLLFQWFRLIVDNRPCYREDVMDLYNINEMFTNGFIQKLFDQRLVVVLKVILLFVLLRRQMLRLQTIFSKLVTYLHASIAIFFQKNVSYPARSSYTLQWLAIPDKFAETVADPAFRKCTSEAETVRPVTTL
jgi:hypothetical protein